MNESYSPRKEDFEFLTDRNIEVDLNFASQGYWKGVATHFFKNCNDRSCTCHCNNFFCNFRANF